MGNAVRHRDWISKMGARSASRALALTVGLVLGLVATESAQAQTLTVLYSFTGGADGGSPYAGLVRDKSGTLYGTTLAGGASNHGTVFKVNTSGKETVLHSFTGGKDGAWPHAGLVQDQAGNLYGTTQLGGSSHGTVFKLDTSGTETVLHSFKGGSSDGCFPVGSLLWDKAGNLYGTTYECGASGYGTVFRITTSGTETVVHSFAGGASDGAYPYYTSLLMDKAGNLYGVTEQGGGGAGYGVVYQLSKSGTLTVLYRFTGGSSDGCNPLGTPWMDSKGNLYGTTHACGASNDGIVWKVSRKGTETILHNFIGRSSDGAYPYAGVIMDAKGNLYGDTEEGGGASAGTVYELSKKGTLTLLHTFVGSDGANLFGGLIRDTQGNFYGTTYQGGASLSGTVWKLTP